MEVNTFQRLFLPRRIDKSSRRVFQPCMINSVSMASICTSFFHPSHQSSLNTSNLFHLSVYSDWEYPGSTRNDANTVYPADSANFLLFLQTLRIMLPDTAYITAATAVTPFTGPDGSPLKDVSGFAAVLDYIVIMNYDVWGSSPTPGPNAPLNNACGNSTQPSGSAQESVAGWVGAGFPAKQIMLGTPAYGYIQSSTATRLIQRRDAMQTFTDPSTIVGALSVGMASNINAAAKQPKELKAFAATDEESVGVRLSTGEVGDDSQQIQFRQLVQQGALGLSNVTGKWEGSGGFIRNWDACSSTVRFFSLDLRNPRADRLVCFFSLSFDLPLNAKSSHTMIQNRSILKQNMQKPQASLGSRCGTFMAIRRIGLLLILCGPVLDWFLSRIRSSLFIYLSTYLTSIFEEYTCTLDCVLMKNDDRFGKPDHVIL